MPPSSSLRAARAGVTAVFLVYGGILSTWVSRIPVIKRDLDLDTAQLSLALLGSPIGLILAVQVVARLVERYSSRVVTNGALLLACAALLLPSAATGVPTLAVALLIFGLMMGALDIAMNTQAVAIERRYGRPITSGIHGWYSIGVLSGAGLGSLTVGALATPVHFAAGAVVLAVVGTVACRTLLGREADVHEEDVAPADARLLRQPTLIALGVIALCCLFAEGAIDDWSGVYLSESQGASLSFAPLGAAAAGAGMAIGRFTGDAIIARIGRQAMLTRAALVAFTGMVIAVAAPSPGVAVAGYFVLGLGVATIVPIAFTLAGRTPGIPPAWAISRVTTIGYAGLFGSPPIVGFVAHLSSLTVGLAVPAVLLLVAALLGRRAPDRGA